MMIRLARGTPTGLRAFVTRLSNGLHKDPILQDIRTIKSLLAGIFTLMFFGAVYFARDMFLPIVIGVLVALTLSPVVRALGRLGVPKGLSAIVLILGSTLAVFLGGYALSAPFNDLLTELPQLSQNLRVKLGDLLSVLKAAQDASDQVENLTAASNAPQTVAVAQPGLLSLAAGTAASFLSLVAAGLVLAMFLLASGNLFYEKLVAALPSFSDKRRAIKTARDVERQISRYFLTITVINAGLGLAIGSAMYLIGFSNPALWGALAFCLNFLPFIGALIGALGVAAFGLIAADSLFAGLAPALVYLTLTTLEGQFLTPVILGRRLELNTVSVFLTVIIWSWLWALPGALMAVPFLVMVKVICDNIERFQVFGSFLGARDVPEMVDYQLANPATSPRSEG
jgi:predicted PurR-regulated permease PerM